MPGVNPPSGELPESEAARCPHLTAPSAESATWCGPPARTGRGRSRPCDGSSPPHRVQTPCLSFEFLSGLLDRRSFVGRLDSAEPDGLLGNLADVPACRLRRFWLACHDGIIGRQLYSFSSARSGVTRNSRPGQINAGGFAFARVPYGMMISTTLRRSAIHAADQLPDLELGPCGVAAAHRWDHPEDRAAARQVDRAQEAPADRAEGPARASAHSDFWPQKYSFLFL
jgi:hypothetical protein